MQTAGSVQWQIRHVQCRYVCTESGEGCNSLWWDRLGGGRTSWTSIPFLTLFCLHGLMQTCTSCRVTHRLNWPTKALGAYSWAWDPYPEMPKLSCRIKQKPFGDWLGCKTILCGWFLNLNSITECVRRYLAPHSKLVAIIGLGSSNRCLGTTSSSPNPNFGIWCERLSVLAHSNLVAGQVPRTLHKELSEKITPKDLRLQGFHWKELSCAFCLVAERWEANSKRTSFNAQLPKL